MDKLPGSAGWPSPRESEADLLRGSPTEQLREVAELKVGELGEEVECLGSLALLTASWSATSAAAATAASAREEG